VRKLSFVPDSQRRHEKKQALDEIADSEVNSTTTRRVARQILLDNVIRRPRIAPR
jgi:hypothetical protein